MNYMILSLALHAQRANRDEEQHFLGLQGIPRRIPDAPDAYAGWNYISSIGSIVSVGATALFLYVIYDILVNQPASSSNPFSRPGYYIDSESQASMTPNSYTIEWVLPSPTPLHSFQETPRI